MSPLALVLIGLLGWLVLRLVLLALVGRWVPPATVAATSMLRRRYTSRFWASTLVELASHLMLATSILIAVGVGGIQLLDSQEHTVAVFGTLQRLTAMANANLPVVIFVCAGMAAATVALYIALTRDHALAKFAALKSDLRPTEEMRPLLDEARDLRRAKESMRTKLNKGLHRTLTLLRINHQLARVTRKLNQRDLERRSDLRLDPKSVTGPAGLRWLTGPRRALGFSTCLLLAASCTSLAITVSPVSLFLLIEEKDLSIAESRARAEWATLKEALPQPVEIDQVGEVASLLAASFEDGILGLFPDGSWMSALVVRRRLLDSSPTAIQTTVSQILAEQDAVTQAALARWAADGLPFPARNSSGRSADIQRIDVAHGPARDPEGDPTLRAALNVVVRLYLAALASGASPSDAFENAINRAPVTFFRDWDSRFLRPHDLGVEDDPYYAVFPGGCATDFRYGDEGHCPPYYSYARPEPVSAGAFRPEDRRRANWFDGSRPGGQPPPPDVPSSGQGGQPVPSGTSGGYSAYQRLDPYGLVGGVLIGRPPKTLKTTMAAATAIVDMHWSASGDGTQIQLTVEFDGATSRSGVFKQRLVWQALRYAVESRPAAVTMLPTRVIEHDPDVERMNNFLRSPAVQAVLQPVSELFVREIAETLTHGLEDIWIYLHPVLRNTPLGCRFIKIDQLIDESGVRDSFVVERNELDINLVAQVRESPYELASILDDAFSSSGREFPLYFTMYEWKTILNEAGEKQRILVEISGARERLETIAEDMDASLRDEIAKFVYIQRFFRGVLMGYFGDSFSLSKLLDLERDSANQLKDEVVTRRRLGRPEQVFEDLERALENLDETQLRIELRELLNDFRSKFGEDAQDGCDQYTVGRLLHVRKLAGGRTAAGASTRTAVPLTRSNRRLGSPRAGSAIPSFFRVTD